MTDSEEGHSQASSADSWNRIRAHVSAYVPKMPSVDGNRILLDFTEHLEISERIGRGGFGEVFKARLVKLSLPAGLEHVPLPILAVKVLESSDNMDEKLRRKRAKVFLAPYFCNNHRSLLL